MADTGKHASERFSQIHALARKRDKRLSQLFDEHSRSSAPLQLMALRANNLVDESMLAELSDEFRALTDPDRYR